MNYVAIRKFLNADVAASVRALMMNEALYETAGVIGDPSWRVGRVAHVEHRQEARAVAEAVLRVTPFVTYQLRLDAFAASRCEVQLTSYGEGGWFKPHIDNGTPDTAARVISWVVYLDLTPRRFTGGDLRLANETQFRPEDGTAIFFPSSVLHEITPISMNGFVGWNARRHTVNGWVRG